MLCPQLIKLVAATLFVEIWQRRQSILAWEWDLEMDDQEEQPRPEFEVCTDHMSIFPISLMTTLQAEVRTRRINPVTKFPEAYLSGYSKFGRIALTTSFVLFLVFALNIYYLHVQVHTFFSSAVLCHLLPGGYHPVPDLPP